MSNSIQLPSSKLVEKSIAQIDKIGIVERIWRKDYSLWKPSSYEITNRLGWLTITDQMREVVPSILAFAKDIKRYGFKKIVLLGMGGSSLGAEVVRQVFGNTGGYPELIVLDSTVPSAVRAVSDAIEPECTLFLVSSKSGTTTEPLVLFHYFKGIVEKVVARGNAGKNFVAITDPGTPLVKLADDEKFRRVFLNPPDIGGRYSILSYFGLVPAALLGINIEMAISRADSVRNSCASFVPNSENPGYQLGAYMGVFARDGKDKCTLITSPGISSLGLWIEQLIAESTGKEGKGILPIVNEPLAGAANYGKDRQFIYLRLDGDENTGNDLAVERLKRSKYTVITKRLADLNDLWGEFYCWEFAAAVAGAVLGINPFDQPDVQYAKEATHRLLKAFVQTGRSPAVGDALDAKALIDKAGPGKYLALMAYVRQTPELDKLFAAFRKHILTKYHIATTLGYGPRFLHSTGQIHKGGPDEGLFLQITADHGEKLVIPGEPYSLGIVADAEAAGDLEALQKLGRPVAVIHCPAGEKAIHLTLKEEFSRL
jgi:glucose-6-phosphate isomerase